MISLGRSGQVETVVADNLSLPGHSPAQYERFARLWHLSRDMSANRSAVDLCTMKMISGLRETQEQIVDIGFLILSSAQIYTFIHT